MSGDEIYSDDVTSGVIDPPKASQAADPRARSLTLTQERDRAQEMRYGGRWLRFFTIDPKYKDLADEDRMAYVKDMTLESMTGKWRHRR